VGAADAVGPGPGLGQPAQAVSFGGQDPGLLPVRFAVRSGGYLGERLLTAGQRDPVMGALVLAADSLQVGDLGSGEPRQPRGQASAGAGH
jgi:hypothetical protein